MCMQTYAKQVYFESYDQQKRLVVSGLVCKRAPRRGESEEALNILDRQSAASAQTFCPLLLARSLARSRRGKHLVAIASSSYFSFVVAAPGYKTCA